MNFLFKDLTERDMDILFMEEFAISSDFQSLFLSKLGVEGAHLLSIEHSKSDPYLGESDLTVLFEHDHRTIALLIEDKINALAMPSQAERYKKRGRLGIESGSYDEFASFIVAPEKYLSENSEAQKYPYCVSYEDILAYFSKINDARAKFKAEQIRQAINKSKNGYQVIKDDAVTDFWAKYTEYVTKQYPELQFKAESRDRGASSAWMYFPVDLPAASIVHKADRGYIDLSFSGCGEDMNAFDHFVYSRLVDPEEYGCFTVKTGKAAAVRLTAPALDFHRPFEEQSQAVIECFEQIKKMREIAKLLR